MKYFSMTTTLPLYQTEIIFILNYKLLLHDKTINICTHILFNCENEIIFFHDNDVNVRTPLISFYSEHEHNISMTSTVTFVQTLKIISP